MADAGTDQANLERLRTYWKRHHAFPSMAELCEVVGLSSTASVFDLVTRLKHAGYVQRVEGRIAPAKRFFARPLLGKVRAGLPQPRQDEDDFEVLTLDDYFVPDPNRCFLARVKGDSMRDAALQDGDPMVVQKNSPTTVGDIVVAVVDGQVTVKYLRQEPAGWFYPRLFNAPILGASLSLRASPACEVQRWQADALPAGVPCHLPTCRLKSLMHQAEVHRPPQTSRGADAALQTLWR